MPNRTGEQYAALALITKDGATCAVLVTSRETGRWVLPKGWAERGLTGPELAAKEALEEAGLVGVVSDEAAGHYSYDKKLPDGTRVPCRVTVFVLHVERMLDDWPERNQRRRDVFSLADAAAAVIEPDLSALLLRYAAGSTA